MKKEIKECPACASKRTIKGSYLGQTDYGLFGHVFRPDGLKPIRLMGSDVPANDNFYACLDCGLLWSTIDKTKLTEVLRKKGKTSTKEKLEL